MIITIIILTFVIIGILLLNYLYKRTNHYKNMISNVEKFINGVNDNIELANFGSSYAKFGIIPNEIYNVKAFNFGIQPESINYDFKMLKMYTKNLNKNCIVLLNIPNLVFTFVDYKTEQANTKYYYFMDKQYINKYRGYKKFLNVHFPILMNLYLIRFIIKDIRKDDYEIRTETKLEENGVTKEAIIRINGWKQNANLSNLTDDHVTKEMEEKFKKTRKILEDMIEYCINHNFRPVIVVPPVSKILSDMISKKFIDKYLFDNIKIANKRNIPVFNYLYEETMQDYKLYINSDFMNLTGRKILTKTILEDLAKIDYI